MYILLYFKIKPIVISIHNSAFNGGTFKPMWNATFDKSESYSSVGVAHFDEDGIPDIIVKYNYGNFPVYQYEQVSKTLCGGNLKKKPQ